MNLPDYLHWALRPFRQPEPGEIDWWVNPYGKVPVVTDPRLPLGMVRFVAPDGRVLLTIQTVKGEEPTK